MPGGNRTGPLGQGPRTGRGLGYCSGYDTPGSMNPVGPGGRMGAGFRRGRGGFGGGYGGGYGRGGGWRNRYYATGVPGWAAVQSPPPAYAPAPAQADPASELEFLKAQADNLSRELEYINKRINELQEG